MELELLDKVVECLLKMVKKLELHVADYPTGLDCMLKDFEDTVLLQQQQSGKPQILGIVDGSSAEGLFSLILGRTSSEDRCFLRGS